MTILQSLDRYYDRMATRGEAESPGYSREKISFAVIFSGQGEIVDKLDLRDHSGKRPQPRLLEVPAVVKRTAGILPNLFWDKTSYVFGRTAGNGRRTAEEHEAFKAAHLAILAETEDEGLLAFARFLERWTPERFDQPPFVEEMLDANFVFRLDGDNQFLHQRQAALPLVADRGADEAPTAFCLVTGVEAPVRRLHPSIKGVEGAQSSGAALVSFNLDAFTSYGKEQGHNAPTSEGAAFRYGAALNRMLDRGSGNRLRRPIGDATVVFWADALSAAEEQAASAAEDLFAGWLGSPPADPDRLEQDVQEAAKLRDALKDIAEGRPTGGSLPDLAIGVRFHVLGLSPNAARLSVRFWLDDDFAAFARRMVAHDEDLAIEPKPWRKPPSINLLLAKTTALQEKFDNIPPLLAGEMTRAVLGGGRYPRTLLAAALIRLRAGDDAGTGWHAAAIRAVLARDRRLNLQMEDIPVSLDRDNANPAYQLGRLFAALEAAQRQALGKVNTTIRDRYFGAASATPASIFPLLLRGAQSHLGKLRKEGKGGWIEREVEEITSHLPPELPRSLRLEAQGRFAIGYYHQRKTQFAGRPANEIDVEGEEEE